MEMQPSFGTKEMVILLPLGLIEAVSFTIISTSTIEAVVPPGTDGTTVDVTVTSPLGTSSDDLYTYRNPSTKLLPPSHFKGWISKRSHYHKNKYNLKTQWKPSQTPNIQFYRVYKRSKVVSTVYPTSKLRYDTHLLWKSSSKKFSLVAVDSTNIESDHIKLKVKH
jgi:hypothetical protein